MLKFYNGEEHQNILILNYNTVILQSVGFLMYVKKHLKMDNPLSHLEGTEFIVNVLQLANKNTASILNDPTIDEEFYFNFIKKKFVEVSGESPIGAMQSYITILLSQNFVNRIHIASPADVGMKTVFPNISDVQFDIFDVDAIVDYINTHKITSLYIHDIDLLKKVIEHPDMDSEQFTYLLSKIGYNYREIEDAAFFKLPEIMDLRDEKRFLLGIVNLLTTDEAESFLL
jgi:hypothetical protein